MIVDPQMLASATYELAKSTSSVSPIPTVVPSLPEYQNVSETGTRTLWYVFSSFTASPKAYAARRCPENKLPNVQSKSEEPAALPMPTLLQAFK